MSDTIDKLREAIEAAVAPILAEHRQQLVGDWIAIFSTLGTATDDDGSYVWVGSESMPPHSRIGLAHILSADLDGTHGDD